MAITAATPLADIKVILNDASGLTYTTAKLIPVIQMAYRNIQSEMQRAGMSTAKEVSASIALAAGTVRLGDGAGLPNDLLYPITVYERGSTSEEWVEMDQKDWEPTDSNSPLPSVLEVWAWREDEIKFRGSSEDRLILIKYMKGLNIITLDSSPIQIVGAEDYLMFRGAELAARYIGQNPSKADELADEAVIALKKFKSTRVHRRQSTPVRRRVNRFRV